MLNKANNPNHIFTIFDKMEQDPSYRKMVHKLFVQGELSFLLHDTQLKIRDTIIRTEEKEILILCSRQLGKSFGTLVVAIEFAQKNPGSIVRIFADTETQVADIINDNLIVIEQLAPPGFIDRRKSDKRWIIGGPATKKNQKLSQIRIGPLAKAHVDGKRGGNASLVILEEGGFVNSDDYKSAIGSVIAPQLLRSRGKLIHVTTSSEDPDHYIHSSVTAKCETKGTLSKYTIYDNPQLSPDQIQEAHDRCISEDQWKREYLCEPVRNSETTVVPEFEESVIVARELPSHTNFQTAIDFGGTLDKHGVLLTYYDFEIAKFRVWDEILFDRNTSTKVIREATEIMENKVTWLKDYRKRITDAPGQILVDLRSEGFTVTFPEKGQGSWEAGINMVRLAFSRGEIEIEPRCKHLIATLKYGRYTSNRKDFLRTEALGHLDMFSALMYGFRHADKSNPFPKYLGKSKFIHYLNDREDKNKIKGLLTGGF